MPVPSRLNLEKRSFSVRGNITAASVENQKDLLQKFPFNPVIISKKAADLMEAKSYNEAITEYLNLISILPNSPPALTALASCYTQIGNFAEAEHYIQRAFKANEKFVPAIVEKAKLSIKTGNLSESNLFLEKVITIEPENIESRVLIAANYLLLGNLQKAEQMYREILELDPNNKEAHSGLGIIYYACGNWSMAYGEFLKALGETQDNADLLIKSASCLVLMKRFSEAQTFIDKAIAVDPTHFMAYLTRGHINVENNRYQEAIDDFTRFMEQNDIFMQSLSPENLVIHQKQKSEILFARSDCYFKLFVAPYKHLDSLYEKLQKELEEKVMLQRQQQQSSMQKQTHHRSERKSGKEVEDEDSVIDEKFMEDFQFRVKVSNNNYLKNAFVDICSARAIHYESKSLADDQLRIYKKVINEYLRY